MERHNFFNIFSAQGLLIPLISKLGIPETVFMTLIFSTFTARHFLKGFAKQSWMFYFGALIDILGFYAFAILKSMTSLCVTPTELGKINAVLAAIESLFPAPISQLYVYIWKVTLKKTSKKGNFIQPS